MPSWKTHFKTYPVTAKKFAKTYSKAFVTRIVEADIKTITKDGDEGLCVQIEKDELWVRLNKTSCQNLAKAFTDDYTKWIGKKVEIEAIDSKFGEDDCKSIIFKPVKS